MIMPSGKGQYFKKRDKVSIEKLQNEHQWSWRVNKEHVLLSVLLSSAGKLINSMRMGCQAVVQALGSSTRYWALIMSLTSMNMMKSKIPVTISIKIHANQAPATSFVYVFVVVNVVNVLWDNGLSPLLNAHTCVFVCCLFACAHVCLNPC